MQILGIFTPILTFLFEAFSLLKSILHNGIRVTVLNTKDHFIMLNTPTQTWNNFKNSGLTSNFKQGLHFSLGWRVGQQVSKWWRAFTMSKWGEFSLHQRSSQPPWETQNEAHGSPALRWTACKARGGCQAGSRSQPSGATSCRLTTDQRLQLSELPFPHPSSEENTLPSQGAVEWNLNVAAEASPRPGSVRADDNSHSIKNCSSAYNKNGASSSRFMRLGKVLIPKADVDTTRARYRPASLMNPAAKP